jgi:hypothetical protein
VKRQKKRQKGTRESKYRWRLSKVAVAGRWSSIPKRGKEEKEKRNEIGGSAGVCWWEHGTGFRGLAESTGFHGYYDNEATTECWIVMCSSFCGRRTVDGLVVGFATVQSFFLETAGGCARTTGFKLLRAGELDKAQTLDMTSASCSGFDAAFDCAGPHR